jgi:hypothetical protein
MALQHPRQPWISGKLRLLQITVNKVYSTVEDSIILIESSTAPFNLGVETILSTFIYETLEAMEFQL